jgi:hypothetical protein
MNKFPTGPELNQAPTSKIISIIDGNDSKRDRYKGLYGFWLEGFEEAFEHTHASE